MSLKQQHPTLPNPEVGGVGSASAMEKLLEAQQQQLDDITSESSFLEFLRNEQNCLAGGPNGNGNGSGGGCGEEVDVDRIFEQVSQLAGAAGEDGKSVEEILREAEQLIRKQHPLFGGNGASEGDRGACDGIREVQRAMCGLRDISCESTPMEMRTGVLEELEAIARREEESKAFVKQIFHHDDQEPPVRDFIRRKSFTISTAGEEPDSQCGQRPYSDQTYTLPTPTQQTPTEMRTKKSTTGSKTSSTGASSTAAKSTTPKKRNSISRASSATPTHSQFPRRSIEGDKENQLQLSQSRIRDLEEIYNLTLNEGSREKKSPSPAPTLVREKTFCDKSTAPSPTRTAPDSLVSWAKERELEGSITELEEKLKDTEERYESLKIQYDTLSQVHRTLRENHGQIQEESDKLKLDVQHLTECANVLRSELQSARSDRDAALELQKILQSELEESRREKKRYQELNEKDTKTIQDLQRQCREMERILMRKHPDSVSALIVASKNSNAKPTEESSQTRRLLEQRIAQLEADAKEQDAKAQGILANVQARFNSVQSKYETHIADLEMQVLSLQDINSKLNEKIIRQMDELSSITSHAAASFSKVNATANATSSSFTQTEDFPEKECIKTRSISVQTDSRLTGTGAGRNQSAGPKRASSANAGGKIPNSLSDSQIQSREDAHLLATIRGMRVDLAIKEKAVQRLTREVEDCKKTIKKLQKERDTYLKPEGRSGTSSSASSTVKGKTYDPAHYADGVASDATALKDAQLKIKLLEADYKTLHDKRLQDLKTLQAAHERELVACHETVRILQQRLAEREEHLHTKEKRRPNHNIDYFALKAKVSEKNSVQKYQNIAIGNIRTSLVEPFLTGWSFEPEQLEIKFDGTADICSQGRDVNFNFKGFGITGKVEIYGHNVGAKEVQVELRSESNTKIGQTFTDSNGIFSFTPIKSGKYVIKVKHDKWHFVNAEYAVTVTTGNTEIPAKSLVVFGFHVEGRVHSDEQPFGNVGFLLYPEKGAEALFKCSSSNIPAVPGMDPKFSGDPRCYTEANKATGTFTFAGVSSGKCRVVPHFNNKAIKFHIKPEAMEFELGRDSLRLPESYKITRFSVDGRVLQTVDGPGVRNAKIKMNGKEVATTGSDGKYTLDNIHASTYTIQVTADDLQFKDHIAKISLSNPALPDIVVSGFKVTSLERRHSEREQRLHMLVEALSKGGKLNGVHIRALAAAAAASSGNPSAIGDEENHNLVNPQPHHHQQQQQQQNATVGGN